MIQIKRSELKQLAQNKLGNDSIESQNKILVMISTSLAARTSYTVVGEDKGLDYEALIGLHDRLIAQDPPHSSPLEHCARVMSDLEHETFIKGKLVYNETEDYAELEIQEPLFSEKGWCNNFKGFISYRYFIDNKLLSL